MFGILFLIIVPIALIIYISIIRAIVKNSSSRVKLPVVLITLVIPITYPFLYLISSNYQKFEALCNENNYKLFKSIETNNFPARYFGDGYKALIEKPYVSFIHNNKAYTPNENWKSEECFKPCSTIQIKQCLEMKCFNVGSAEEIDYPKYRSTYLVKDHEGIFNSLLRESTEQLVSSEHGLLAEKYSYTFYLYGTGWATILGAASGSAPSRRCENYSRFNYLEITPPKKGA
jgi:hypothetical protein